MFTTLDRSYGQTTADYLQQICTLYRITAVFSPRASRSISLKVVVVLVVVVVVVVVLVLVVVSVVTFCKSRKLQYSTRYTQYRWRISISTVRLLLDQNGRAAGRERGMWDGGTVVRARGVRINNDK